jgi:hypothetical protein
MSLWCQDSCFHQTLLKDNQGQEFLIIFCKFCRQAGFGLHKTFQKTIIDQGTFITSERYQCTVNCLFCHRSLIPNKEVLILNFVNQFDKPHIDLNTVCERIESEIFEPVNNFESVIPKHCELLTNHVSNESQEN